MVLCQVVEESQQRKMVQQFLDLLDEPFFSKQPLPSIPNLPPKAAAAPDPSQVCALQAPSDTEFCTERPHAHTSAAFLPRQTSLE